MSFAGDDPVTHEIKITFPQQSGIVRHAWVSGSLPCPDNTVFSEAYTAGTGMDICTRSDKGYQSVSSQLYQSFSGNSHPVQGVQVFGLFLNSSYNIDDSRLNLDADGNMTKPLKLGVAFYEIGDNGYPGKEVYRESMEVYGQKTSANANNSGGNPDVVTNIYSFTLNLKEKVRMESGYVSVWSEDTTQSYSSSFSLIGDSGQPTGICLYSLPGSSDVMMTSATFNFCFLGDINESLAQRGIKLNRILAPSATERGKFAKVQVELTNYGAQSINDATLNLYEGDSLLAKETVDATIKPEENYKYTFKKRIDCSSIGNHEFTIENVTPGDEGYASKDITFSTTNSDETCSSGGSYNGPYKYITSVDIGSIHNESSYSTYSDYRNMQTDITKGQTLTLKVGRMAANGDFNKAWVDWNGNGLFDDAGEDVGSLPNGTVDISIPDGVDVTPGAKTLRIVLCDHTASACERYQYGETEDYTLNVVRPEGSPALTADANELDFTGSGTKTVKVVNDGTSQLEATAEVRYELPLSDDVMPYYNAPSQKPGTRPVIKNGVVPESIANSKKAEADGNDDLTLSYANNYYASTGANYTYVDYAHFYPGKALAAIKGMKLTAIDVFIATPSRKSFVAVWKSNGTQYTSDATPIVKQQFTPTANSWNHIVLDTPVDVDGSDLFVGCALEGCIGITYLVGTDAGPAKVGFGDLLSIENSGYWWSLADLGNDANVLVKATFSGERTPAVNWLKVDKKSFSLNAGEETGINATTDATGLTDPCYDAVINFKSNDQLAGSKSIPVYLDLSGNTDGISLVKSVQKPQFRITSDRRISVLGNKRVSLIALYTVDGRELAMEFNTNSISTPYLRSGIYVVRAVFSDNTDTSATICVK